MDSINWDEVGEALNYESPQKKDLIKEIVKLRKLRSDFVDFCGWLMTETMYAKYNTELKKDFIVELDNKIDIIFNEITIKQTT